MNCFCGKLSSFSPSILFFFFLVRPSCPCSIWLWPEQWQPGEHSCYGQRWGLSPAPALRVSPAAWHWGGWEGGGKGTKLTPVSGTLRAFLESIASGQGVGTTAPFYQGPLCGSLGTREEGLQGERRQKHRAVLFPAQIPSPKSWEPSEQILRRSAIAINNNMYHQLWWHYQRKTRSWFYPFPQSSLNLNFDLFHLSLFCYFASFVFSASHPKMLGNAAAHW